MERRIELRHQRWKFQESPISSSPPSLFQKFPPNSLPTSVKPPPKEINEHPIYAHENHAGTRFPPRPWWNSPGVVSMSRDKKKEKEREKRKNWSIPCFRGCFQRDQNGSWTWRNGWGETSGGEFMRDNFHGGKWKVGIRQCHEREEGERKVCDKRRCRREIGRVSRGEDVEWKNCGEGIARNYIFLILYIRY